MKRFEVVVPAVFTFTVLADTDDDALTTALKRLKTEPLPSGVDVDVEVAEVCADIEEASP